VGALELPSPTDGKRTVLSIREVLAERAHKARARVCPPGHCQTCFFKFYRLLFIHCCICNGKIDPRPPRPFSNQ
jgi:hypothetical protein